MTFATKWSNSNIEILVFARVPQLGQVKSRLGATLGPEEALVVYEKLFRQQLRQVQRSGLASTLWFTPSNALAPLIEWLQTPMRTEPQAEGDLGQRMHAACCAAFARGRQGVVLIGTDCPDLDSPKLETLAQLVAKGNYVLQPALDGGYVAFGLPHACPEVFQSMPWSTSRVLALTIDRLRALEIKPLVLEALPDVDDEASLRGCQLRHPWL